MSSLRERVIAFMDHHVDVDGWPDYDVVVAEFPELDENEFLEIKEIIFRRELHYYG